MSKGYVSPEYLRLAAALVAETKRRSYALMRLQPGCRVLDVGCGPGTDTIPLTELVGPMGEAVGVDFDPAMVAEADRRAAQAQVSERVRHRQSDAAALPYGDGAFDACRSERLFQHLMRPEAALAEMVRVTWPGGWIVVVDTDWGTLSIDTADAKSADLERRLARVKAEQGVNNGYAGRQLHRLFQRAGLADIAIELAPSYTTHLAIARQIVGLDAVERSAVEAGVLTHAELDHWHTRLEAADAAGVFFASVSLILAAGRKV